MYSIFVRFALLMYKEASESSLRLPDSEAKTNEPGTHLNSYSYELRVTYNPR